MKLISLQCPSCGSNLEVNSELEKYTCNYCGTTTILDSEEINVSHTISRLNNYLIELREYYENGNDGKTYELASQLIKEYPNNKEVKKYYDLSKDKGTIVQKNNKDLEYQELVVTEDKLLYGQGLLEKKNALNHRNEIANMLDGDFKGNEELEEYLSWYDNIIKKFTKEQNNRNESKIIIAIIIGLSLAPFVLFLLMALIGY